MAQAGTQVCLVIAIVLSVCACARVGIYMWLSVFIELLPGKTRKGAQCTQSETTVVCSYVQHISSS